MGLMLALKAFMKAWKEPEKAKTFLEDTPKQVEISDPSHLNLLTLLQQSGRLIDFLKEDITSFSDDQIGGAVRQIHADSAKVLEEFVTIRPIQDENEGSFIHVEKGYDPALIKITGKVTGEGPFSGVLVHKGWKAHKKSLPKKIGGQTKEVICPSVVEVK